MTSTAQILIMRIFSFLCVPMACWQLWLFPDIPNYHLQHFFIYPLCVYMIWLVYNKKISVQGILKRSYTYIPLLLVTLALQVFALWHYSFPAQDVSATVQLLYMCMALAKLIAQWPFIFIFLEFCRFTILNTITCRALLTGALFTCVALLLLCVIQGLYIYTIATTSSLWQTVHAASKNSILAISPYIESRWGTDAVYNFYAKGAYSVTSQRINGFFEEASILAAWIGTFFLPLSLGLTIIRGEKTRNKNILGWFLTISLLLLLFLVRSTTAQIIAIVGLILLVVVSFTGRKKLFTIFITSGCICICIFISLYAPHVATYLQKRTQYFDVKNSPRIVIMLDTLDIIKKHPFTGVGRGNFSKHIVLGERYQAQVAHDPELKTWKQQGDVPPLSAFLGFAAEYGIPLLLLLAGGVIRVWYRIYKQWRTYPTNVLFQYVLAASSAWCILAFIAGMGLLDMRNPLFWLPLFSFLAIADTHDRSDSDKEYPHAH